MILGRETSWKAMLGKDERDVTEEEVAALEATHGPFLPADGEGVEIRAFIQRAFRTLRDCGPRFASYNV